MTNEQRARLVGLYVGISDPPELAPVWMNMGQGSPHCLIADEPPSFDTDANAVAELRKFVRARGKETAFIDALQRPMPISVQSDPAYWMFDCLDATPAQQCAAFDIVFKDELEKL